MTYTGELIMPTSYVEVAEEEMTYLDGGAKYWFNVSRSTCANIIDTAITIISLGCAIGKGISKLVATKGSKYVVSITRSAAVRIGIAAGIASKVANSILSLMNFSIGTGIAMLLDRFDKTGYNGRVQF